MKKPFSYYSLFPASLFLASVIKSFVTTPSAAEAAIIGILAALTGAGMFFDFRKRDVKDSDILAIEARVATTSKEMAEQMVAFAKSEELRAVAAQVQTMQDELLGIKKDVGAITLGTSRTATSAVNKTTFRF